MQLLALGSSLGGARPKASVLAPDNSLWIAKFPSRQDELNVGVWEMVAHNLATKCGIDVPEAKLETFSDNGSTFLIKRFDRKKKRRLHFASAMALLGETDGNSDRVSYLDIATIIKLSGAKPKKDLENLWKRIVFNMAISNTDDHLRNHGFILSDKGWVLSPAYDVNSSIYGNTLSLNINNNDNSISFELALSTAEYYDISYDEALSIIKDIKKTVSDNWRNFATTFKLSKEEINHMEPAFAMKYK